MTTSLLNSVVSLVSWNRFSFFSTKINYSRDWIREPKSKIFPARISVIDHSCHKSLIREVNVEENVGGFPATVIHLQRHTRPLSWASYHAPSIPITTDHWTPSSYRDLCRCRSCYCHTLAPSLYMSLTSPRNILLQTLNCNCHRRLNYK